MYNRSRIKILNWNTDLHTWNFVVWKLLHRPWRHLWANPKTFQQSQSRFNWPSLTKVNGLVHKWWWRLIACLSLPKGRKKMTSRFLQTKTLFNKVLRSTREKGSEINSHLDDLLLNKRPTVLCMSCWLKRT